MTDSEHHEFNHQSDDEHPMPSVRSDLPSRSRSVNARKPDDLLILRSEFLQLKANNHHLDFDSMKTDYPVILEILRGHHLAYALAATTNVPLIYLQQFWNTITYIPEEHNYRFEAFVDHFLTKLTKKRLRLILQLPNKTDVQGKQGFDDFATESQICFDIRSLGYSEPLQTSTKFKRMYLPPIWNTLFSILNRCLTPKHTGLDRCNIHVLRLFHGIAFCKHYDYSTIFWNELEEIVSDKGHSKARKFVPYQRFLQLIIRSMMRSNRDIPLRSSAPVCPEYDMKYLHKQDEGEFLNILPLPDALLAYANQDAPCVKEYRALRASMVQPEPEGPTQEAIPRIDEGREGFDQGEQRKNENERGIEGVGGASVSGAQEELSIQIEHNIPEESSNDDERTESDNIGDADDDDSDESDDDDSDEFDDDDSDNDDDSNVQMSDMQIDNVIYQTTTVEGEIEGVLIENGERLSAGTLKEHGESEKRSEKQTGPSQTVSVSRVATSIIQSHVFGSSIETVIMDPVMHAQSTPPSHSVISQQISVSFSHGELAHLLLLGSHLENLDIEQGRHLLRSPTSFAAHVSLEPYTLPGTHKPYTIARLSDAAGTSRVEPSTGILQGQGGSPTRANIMPTLSVCHTVDSTAVTTGNLSGPVVRFPKFVSRKYLDDALKAVQDSFATQFESLKRIYKGKEIVADFPPPPPTPQPQVKQCEMSVDELKSLLYAKLLSQATDIDPENSDLLGVLRRSVETQTNVVTVDHFNLLKQEVISSTETIQKTLQKLIERVQALEDTCKEHAKSRKRRHDDQGDADQHEGENKRQKTTEASGTVEPGESSKLHVVGTREDVGNRQIVLYVEPRVEKPEGSEVKES